jgi:putative ABC transport system ATP-binding protein
MALITGPVIAVEEVVRRFRRGSETVQALAGVSVQLYGGELTVAAGPSGSGKTTLLSILAGIERPDAGAVHTHPPLPVRVRPDQLGWRHLAFVPQALALLDELTVAENVHLPAILDRTNRSPEPDSRHATEQLLEQLQIDHLAGRYPSHTSGGEQQRTAVARALRLRPLLLLGDEPTGHQDRARIELLLTILRQHAYNGNAVLLASHDQEVIAAADRVITLADGQITSDTRNQAHTYG